jgi:hypothetical protein
MRLLSRETEGGLTVVDWDDGFIGLSRKESNRKAFAFHLERWPCCPGSLELSIELFGMVFVAYNEGGPCQLESLMDEWEDEPLIEIAQPARRSSSAKGSRDWQSVPTPAAR